MKNPFLFIHVNESQKAMISSMLRQCVAITDHLINNVPRWEWESELDNVLKDAEDQIGERLGLLHDIDKRQMKSCIPFIRETVLHNVYHNVPEKGTQNEYQWDEEKLSNIFDEQVEEILNLDEDTITVLLNKRRMQNDLLSDATQN